MIDRVDLMWTVSEVGGRRQTRTGVVYRPQANLTFSRSLGTTAFHASWFSSRDASAAAADGSPCTTNAAVGGVRPASQSVNSPASACAENPCTETISARTGTSEP